MAAINVLALGAAVISLMGAAGGQWLIIVSGLGGEARFRERFHEEATVLADAAVERWGVSGDHVVWLAEDPSLAPDRISGRSTRDEIAAVIGRVAEQASADDGIVVVLIGHGAADGEPRLNLPGRDLTAGEWSDLLDGLGDRPIAFINTASSSGGFVEAVSAPNRITITATRSSRERTDTRFARFFVEAFAEDVADTDKDDRVSFREAYDYAVTEVARSYDSEGVLLTEHALLEDPTDLAGRFFLGGGVAGRVPEGASPELTALYAEKARLEAAIADLGAVRESMSESDFEDSLEELVVDLTLTTRAIDQAEGGTE